MPQHPRSQRKAGPEVTAGDPDSSGAAASPPATTLPRRAWIIVGLHWEHNDEFAIPAGEFTGDKVYFEEQAAREACSALTNLFFAETPAEFGVCWDEFDLDPETATWDDLRQAGFPEPYSIKELEP
jgi:hypothetical protein